MQPEQGDKRVTVRRQDVAAAARSVGIEPGDTVMFHSSLSSMGTVEGGPNTVIDGFLDAVSPGGTVAAPALCRYEGAEQETALERWDPKTTPSYLGALPETMRKRPDAIRSDHFTHSVAAVGARAAELTANHGSGGLRPSPWNSKAFCEESPWGRFRQWNAAYCFIGVSFQVNTMVHYVESTIVERALQRARPEARARLAAKVIDWRKPGVWPRMEIEDRSLIEEALAREGIVRYGRIGSATLRCARAKPMVERWVAMLEADPVKWFPPDFVAWLREAGQ